MSSIRGGISRDACLWVSLGVHVSSVRGGHTDVLGGDHFIRLLRKKKEIIHFNAKIHRAGS